MHGILSHACAMHSKGRTCVDRFAMYTPCVCAEQRHGCFHDSSMTHHMLSGFKSKAAPWEVGKVVSTACLLNCQPVIVRA